MNCHSDVRCPPHDFTFSDVSFRGRVLFHRGFLEGIGGFEEQPEQHHFRFLL